MSRDNARTPMQWSGEENAGFTTGTPWLKVNPNYRRINVADQERDPDSVLRYYRRLIALRKCDEYRELFTYGTFVPAFTDREGIMAYYRQLDGVRVLVAANFGKEIASLTLEYPAKKLLLSNMDAALPGDTLTLRSCEVIAIEC